MPHERRHFIRVLFDAPAHLTMAHGTALVRVLDMSLRGALINVPENLLLPVGSFCRLQLHLGKAPSSSRQRITMRTRVVYRSSDCAGLLCLHTDLDSVTHLRRLIELQLGDPALLERDLAELGVLSSVGCDNSNHSSIPSQVQIESAK